MTERFVTPGEQLITDLQTWAAEYAEKSDGRMDVLKYLPDVYPGQDGVSVHGEPSAAAIVDSIAEIAQPRYPEVLQLLEQQEASTNYVSMIGELLAGGNNVELVTNHGDLIDIAVAHAALYSTLKKQSYEMHTGIIISKMVSFLAYKLGDEFAPCTDVLKVLESETFLSYPKTESTKKHLKDRLLPNEVDRHNRKMRDYVTHKLGQGGLLLAMAASGTTDKPVSPGFSTIGMDKIGTGTLALMQQPNTYVAPMAVWYKSEQPVMQLADIPRIIKTETDAHTAMQKIAATLTQNVPGKTFAYSG